MATVESVNGPVDVDELGLTLIHEHFRSTDEALRFQFPHLYDEDAEWEAAMADATRGQGPRRDDRRGAERDVPHPRRRVQQAGGRRERPADPARHGRLHLRAPPAAAAQPHRGPDRRDLRPRDRERHPGDGDQAGVHQVRGRRAGRQPQRREDPPRRGPRVGADRAPDHGPLAPRVGDRSRADEDLHGGGRGPGQGPDRPHRRHRQPRVHRAPARHRLLDRPRPLRPRHLPADRAPQRHHAGAPGAGPRRADVPVPGLLLDARLVHAGGRRDPAGERGARTGA